MIGKKEKNMDWNQKKDKARNLITNWVNQREILDYPEDYVEKENEKYRKMSKQYGLTKLAKELNL